MSEDKFITTIKQKVKTTNDFLEITDKLDEELGSRVLRREDPREVTESLEAKWQEKWVPVDVVLSEYENAKAEWKQKLQEFARYLYAEAPLFCTHGKQQLDCLINKTSPCKLRHKNECNVFLRIQKFEELLKEVEAKP